MSSRPRHPGQPSDTSKTSYKVWKPQEKQVEPERPRYRTTTTNQTQRDQTNYRGYNSDSPATASTSQYRSGTSTSKTSLHPIRPSTSNSYPSRSQQPVSNSATPSAPQKSQNYHPQPQRSQAEIHDSRYYSHKRSTSTSTPALQPSYERVPSSDEFAKSSRTNPYPRSGAPVSQTTPGPETPSQDASSSSRTVRDRENDREKERGRDREKEKVREKPKEISDRHAEREMERRADPQRDVSRDAYRDRDRVRERDRERRSEVASHRDLKSTSRAPARDAQDPRTREPGAPAPSHRRNRPEEIPSSSVTARRLHTDARQPSTSAVAAQSTPLSHPISGGLANVPPTPRAMPVYLPERQPTSAKMSHERASSNPPVKGVSGSDAEQLPRREQYYRASNDPRSATAAPVPRDSRPERVQGDRPSESSATQMKNKLGAGFRSIRSILPGSQVPPTPVLKPSEVELAIPRDIAGPSSSSLSVLPAENHRRASAKPHFVSIRAGQGPSDPQPPDTLYKQPVPSTQESHFDTSERPSTTQPSGGLVQDRIKSYETYIQEKMAPPIPSRANGNSVEPTSQPGPTSKTSTHQYTSTEPISRDRAQTSEPPTREITAPISSRVNTNIVEPVNRPAPPPKQSAIQPARTESASGDRIQICEPSARAEAPAPSRVYTNNPEPMNRTASASKTSMLQPNGAESLIRDRAQRYDTSTRVEGNAPASSNAHTNSVESAKRSVSNPKPSVHQSSGAEPASRDRIHPREALPQPETISLPPRTQTSSAEPNNRLAAKQYQSARMETVSRDHIQSYEDTTRSNETFAPPSHTHTIRSAKEVTSDRLQSREVSTRQETNTLTSHAHGTGVEAANRPTMVPKPNQSTRAEPPSRDTKYTYEDSVRPEITAPRSSRAQTSGVESTDRSARVEVTNRDHLQTHETSTRPEMAAPAPPHAHTSTVEVASRFAAVPKPSQPTTTEHASRERIQPYEDPTVPSGAHTHEVSARHETTPSTRAHVSGGEPINRYAEAGPTSRDRIQTYEVSTRPETAPPSRAHVGGDEPINRSAKAEAEATSRDRLQTRGVSTRSGAATPSRAHTSNVEVASRFAAAPISHQPTTTEPAIRERVQTYEDSPLPSGAHVRDGEPTNRSVKAEPKSRDRSHEVSTRMETSVPPSSRVHATSVEPTNNFTAAPKPYQSARTELTTSRDRDDSTRPEVIDPANRSTRADPTSRDRLQTHEAFIQPEAPTLTPRLHTSGVGPTGSFAPALRPHQPTNADTASRFRTQASDVLTQQEFPASVPSRAAVSDEIINRPTPMPKPAISRSIDVVSSIRQAAIRTVRFDVPDSEPATSPGIASTDLPQVISSMPYPSQSASAIAVEVRRPPSPVSLAATTSLGSHQPPTPPSPAHHKLPSSLQPRDRSPPHAGRAVEQQLPEEPPTQQVTEVAFKASLPKSVPSQMDINDARAVTHTRPQALAAVSSQSRQETILQMPSQSTKVTDEPIVRKPGDSHALPVDRSLKQDSIEVSVVSPQTTSSNPHRTISNPTHPPASVIQMSSTTTASKPSAILPTSMSRPTPSQSRINSNDVRPAEVEPKNERYVPPEKDKSAGSPHFTAFHDPPSMPEVSQGIASISVKEREATAGSHNSTLSIAQHIQDNVVPSSSSSEQSRGNHRDVRGTRQKIDIYAPPQSSAQESARDPFVHDAPVTANIPQSSLQNIDPKLSTATSVLVRQPALASKPTMPQDILDDTDMAKMETSHSLNPISLTSASSTSAAAADQPPQEVGLPKRWDSVLNDHLSPTVPPAQKKQEADDRTRLRNQPREGRLHASINPAPPTSSGPGMERSRPLQTGAADDTSQPAHSRSWYQNAKQPEMRSPRPSATDLPQPTVVSNQYIPGPNLQPLSRTASHGGNTRDLGPQSIATVVQTPSGSGTIDQYGNHPKMAPPTVAPSASTVNHASRDSRLNDFQSPRPVVPASRDGRHRENTHDLTATRQRVQDVAQAAIEGHRVDTYPSQVSTSVQQPTPHVPSRFPVVEDVVERPGTANQSERIKFSYASAPAPDLHQGLLSPVQQAIRAPPTPKPRLLSQDAQSSEFSSRAQPDVPGIAAPSQQAPSRSQPPYGTLPRLTPALLAQTTKSSIDSTPSIMTQGPSSHSTNPAPPSRPDESTTSLRMASSVYPSVPAYPTALNRSDSQVYPQTQNSTEGRRKDSNSSDSSHLASRHAPSAPDMSRPNIIPRSSDGSQKPSVNLSQGYPASQEAPVPPTTTSASASTHHRTVSLTNSTPQPSPVHVPRPKLSYSSINPPHATPPTPAGSLYRFNSDSQQTIVSTRVPVAGYASTPILPQSRLPQPPSRVPSKESILMTPASIANMSLPKPRELRASSMPPVTRQQSKESKESSKKKNGFFSSMFRKAPTQRTPEVWHPPTSIKAAEANRSQSSLPSTGKARVLPSNSNTRPTDITRPGTERRMPPPITVDLPPRAPAPDQKVFSAFKILHTKRNRTMSHASVEAQDGQTHTATNTVVGSPVQSPNSIFIPRDPIVAAKEWVVSEEAEPRNHTKRRRRPGVVFDIEEDPPEPPPGTAPKKKLSRRRQ